MERVRDSHPLILFFMIDIAEYIGGKKALFNFVYYDTWKPGILERLGVFMDDAIGGLIAGCMTKMLE